MKITQGNIEEKLSTFNDLWHPRIIGQLNGQAVKIAKIQGEFVWHTHQDEDELFWVIKGSMKIELRDQVLQLKKGDFAIIPRGVEHRPVAEDETHILMFEPLNTVNTGDQQSDLTRTDLETI